MKRNSIWCGVVLIALLLAGLVTAAAASESSGCVVCHLDKELLVKSLSEVKTKTSSMQSGAG